MNFYYRSINILSSKNYLYVASDLHIRRPITKNGNILNGIELEKTKKDASRMYFKSR